MSDTRQMPMEALWPLLQEQLARGSAVLRVTGSSMRPLLRGGRDAVRLERLTRPAWRGEIVLYRRSDGSFVLHRVIRTFAEGCICCGDAQWECELVPHERMLARATELCLAGRWRSAERTFAERCWTAALPVRRYPLAVLRLLGGR